LVAALTITVATGPPSTLPDIALNSEVLFHAERAAALLAAWVFVLVILTRAWAGELPSELSGQGIKYSGERTREATEDAVAAILDDLGRLERRIERLEEGA
jgi:hypothetical protein